MKKSTVKITRYNSGKFYVDIVEAADSFEAWLGHRDIGCANLMFGVSARLETYDSFVGMVEANLPGHKELFKDEYMR